MKADYLEQMQAHVDEGGRLDHRNAVDLLGEVRRLNAILSTPLLVPFTEAVIHEAKHQRFRWGDEHDASKTAWDWYWTLGYLGGKAAHAALERRRETALHHTVTAAAMLANWHRQLAGD